MCVIELQDGDSKEPVKKWAFILNRHVCYGLDPLPHSAQFNTYSYIIVKDGKGPFGALEIWKIKRQP